MRLAPALLALVLAACHTSADARTSAQVRYEGRTLAEWWPLLRDPDDVTATEARRAITMMGPSAVPFLAAKAASHDLGDVIGGGVSLEHLCPNAIPAMEAARADYPSAALEQAIRRVKADAASHARPKVCAENGEPVRREPRGSSSGA